MSVCFDRTAEECDSSGCPALPCDKTRGAKFPFPHGSFCFSSCWSWDHNWSYFVICDCFSKLEFFYIVKVSLPQLFRQVPKDRANKKIVFTKSHNSVSCFHDLFSV